MKQPDYPFSEEIEAIIIKDGGKMMAISNSFHKWLHVLDGLRLLVNDPNLSDYEKAVVSTMIGELIHGLAIVSPDFEKLITRMVERVSQNN